MAKAESEGDQYLRQYPHLLKWINQCAACQHRGRKPAMPADIFPGAAARNLRRYFAELAINENGLCKQCASTRAAPDDA